MNQTRGHDGRGIRSPRDGLRAKESFKVDGLAGSSSDAEGLLEFLPVADICEKAPRSLGSLLLQSLQDEDTASAIGQGQKRNGRVILA